MKKPLHQKRKEKNNMISLSDYFDPVSIEKPQWSHLAEPSCLSHNLSINTDSNLINDISAFHLVIVGVPDDRQSPNEGCSNAPDDIRTELYQLSRIPGKPKIADLGNLKRGANFKDTLAGLCDVITFLLHNNVIPLIIGGSSTLISSVNKAFITKQINYSYSAVDSRIDWINESKETDSFNYLHEIIPDNPYLNNFTNIGYQTYLNDIQIINRLKKLNHDLIRIGEVRNDLHETEPVFRDSDFITFDISSVRQSDAPGTFAPSPNGFYGEEICLLSRYAGLSDKLRVIGFFELNPLLDNKLQTTRLSAQMIWFFLEGFSQKQNESAALGEENSGRFVNYHVRINENREDIVFVKSTLTNRWWIEYAGKTGEKHYFACSYKDYLQANENEIPPRWLKAISRTD